MNTLANAGDRAEILRRLNALRPESVRQWGRMTPHQAVCHLSDSFRAVSGQKAVSDVAGPLQRTVVKWIALYAPLRWPPGILTRPEMDQEISGTAPAEFAADVAELEGLVARVAAEPQLFRRISHPIFGPLSDKQLLRWGYLHMDHHLRQFGV